MEATWERWQAVLGWWLLAQLIVAAVAVLVVRRRRHAGLAARRAWLLTAAEFGLVSGTVPWLWMAFTPIGTGRSLSLHPWRDLVDQFSGDAGTVLAQIIGNLLVFAAFGLFAPLRWRVGLPTVVAAAAVGSLSIEIVQYLAGIGRVTSIGDVMLNVAGAALACLPSLRFRTGTEARARSGGP